MSDLGCYLYVSHSNSYYFTNACNNDMLIYTENSNQNIHLGMTSNSKSMLVINSNSTLFNASNVIVQSNLIVNGLLTASNIDYVTNNLTILNSVTIQNDLTVFDVATLCNNININGATTISNALITTGATTSHSNAVNISGLTTLSNGLTVYNNGTTTLSNQVNIYGALQVSSNIITSGLTNRIWDFSGTISDTSKTPGYVSKSYISGSNITVSSNTPFSNINTEGSIYLPGITGNYISLPQPTTTALPDTTIECWYYQTATPATANGSTQYLIGNMTPNSTTNYWSFGIDTNNQLAFYGYIGTTGTYVTAATITNNTWNHIAMSYSNASKTFYMFLNGTLQTLTATGAMTGSGTTAVTFTNGASNISSVPLTIGQYNNVALGNTYISNFRWTNSVLYTANFTPSRYPLQPALSNALQSTATQLLLRAPLYNPITNTNAVHSYDSLRSHSLPADAMIYADCYGTNLPNLSGAYTPVFDSNITKSIVFNAASSNYLSFPPQTFNIATKGFTAISKMLTWSNYSGFIFGAANAGINNLISLYQTGGINEGFLMFNGSTQVGGAFISGTTSLNTVNTIISRYDPFTNGGTVTTWINGSNVASSNNWNASIGSDRVLNSVNIGNPTGPPYINGNIYNLAVYNRALTDKEIQDASAALMVEPSLPNKSTIEIGNANGKPALTVQQDGTLQIAGPITTTNNQSYSPIDYGVSNLSIPGSIVGTVPAVATTPFNGTSEGSLYLNGTNNITLSNSIFATSIKPGFTAEAWVNVSGFPASGDIYFMAPYNNPWALGINQNSNIKCIFWDYQVSGVTQSITSGNVMQINTWYHAAMTHDGTTCRLFLNGILQASTTAALGTGVGNASLSLAYSPGMYIASPRVVYGSALYTASFTPPTAPLAPSPTGTTALLLRTPQNPGRVLIPKIGGSTQVQAYPPAAMTANFTNIQTTAYGTGTYIASYSAIRTYDAYNAFDKNNSTFWQWTAPAATTVVDSAGTSYVCEYIQLQMPISINVSSYYVNGTNINYPTAWSILASTNSLVWDNINNQTGQNTSAGVTYTVNTSKAYNYYRFIYTASSGAYPVLAEWTLYGTQESISITPNGQVGLGVTRPTQQLEVAGNAIINGNISAGNIGMFRNRIINGDMRINQRGVTSVVISSGTAGTGGPNHVSVDRFSCYYNITTGGIRQEQITLTNVDNPFQYGLKFSYKVTASSANTSYSYIMPNHCIEATNLSDFQWGTAYAQSVTLSFWLKTNIASGNIIAVSLRSYDNGTSYVAPVSIRSPGSWQYVILVIPGPTFGNWSTGLQLSIGPDNKTTTSVINTWNSGNVTGVTSMIDIWATANNYVEFTGVQLEKGTIATPFEFRPYAVELELCQRYYYQLNGVSGNSVPVGTAVAMANNSWRTCLTLPVAMRAQPTFTTNSASAFSFYVYGTGINNNSSSIALTVDAYSPNGNQIVLNVGTAATNMTAGYAGINYISATGAIGFSAEL